MLDTLSGALDDCPDAVRVGDRQLSREQLLGRATAVADRLYGADTVAVDTTSPLETVVAVVAGILAGVPVVPIRPDLGAPQRARILRESGASLLITTDDPAPQCACPSMPIDSRWCSSTSYPPVGSEQTALILYTRGTTGAPKGVRVSRRALTAELDALAEAWAWTPDDLLVHGLPASHPQGLVQGILGPLRIGSRLAHVAGQQPAAYAAAQGTLYLGLPRTWARICAEPASARALRPARLLVSGGATLTAPEFVRLAELTGHRMVEQYGAAETLVAVSSRACGDRRPGSVGTPLRGVTTRLVNEKGEIVPCDGTSVGELQIRGPILFSSYVNGTGTGKILDDEGWFATGDIATITPSGRHRIVGRTETDLINSGGHRIGAAEVEDTLLAHPDVQEAAVVGTPHPDLGQQVTAYVVAAGANRQRLVDYVAGMLPTYKRARQLHLVDRLPRDDLGNVCKRSLR